MITHNNRGKHMQTVIRANTISTAHTGNQTFAADTTRSYFFIVVTSGSASVSFGGGDGYVPLSSGQHYNPPIAPIGEIDVITTGTYVVHMG